MKSSSRPLKNKGPLTYEGRQKAREAVSEDAKRRWKRETKLNLNRNRRKIDEVYMGPNYGEELLEYAKEYREHYPDAKLSEIDDALRRSKRRGIPEKASPNGVMPTIAKPLHTPESIEFLRTHPATAYERKSGLDRNGDALPHSELG